MKQPEKIESGHLNINTMPEEKENELGGIIKNFGNMTAEKQYWKERCLLLEKSLDPTYCEREKAEARSNYFKIKKANTYE